jgi:hypothetical protein
MSILSCEGFDAIYEGVWMMHQDVLEWTGRYVSQDVVV